MRDASNDDRRAVPPDTGLRRRGWAADHRRGFCGPVGFVDPTGAGDVLAGATMSTLGLTNDLLVSVRVGTALAALKVTGYFQLHCFGGARKAASNQPGPRSVAPGCGSEGSMPVAEACRSSCRG
jgi:hypothetical protein